MNDAAHDLVDSAREQVADRVVDPAKAALERSKPRLRGWFHAAVAPAALFGGVALVASSPTPQARAGAVVFTVCGFLLFSVSAVYNIRTWATRTELWMRRWDHSNIFLLIAGSYTPVSLLLLEGAARVASLSLVWACAAAGVVFKCAWPHAPRWLGVSAYVAMGWVAVLFARDFANAGAPDALALLAVGGVLYTLGGLVYALRRPNPLPGWFGFHEVFHALTVAAFVAHFAAIHLTLSGAGGSV